jgi:signal transduction histidine kinase
VAQGAPKVRAEDGQPTTWAVGLAGRITGVNAGVVLAVVLSAGVLLVALAVATGVVLRAVRGSTTAKPQDPVAAGYRADDAVARLDAVLGEVRDIVAQLDRSVHAFVDVNFDMRRFERSVLMLADLEPVIAHNLSRLAASGVSSNSAEVSDSRIFAELNHALQTPLRGLGYAFRNLENLPDNVLLEERAKRLADMTVTLDSCTSALVTFRGLVDTVASVPARQPSLNEAVRAFADSIPHPSGEPVRIDFAELPDRVNGFSNHYLLTMLQPLVENAIEGCVPGGTVEITCTDHGGTVEFTVFNPVDHPVAQDILFAPQRTTKDGHQGLGVSIVSRLVEFERGDLTADITDAGVRMRVALPRR